MLKETEEIGKGIEIKPDTKVEVDVKLQEEVSTEAGSGNTRT